MKSTERFKETIKAYLDKRAETDELFRVRYEATTRTIDDVVTYILNQVKASGCCGFRTMKYTPWQFMPLMSLTWKSASP